ncbi:MAG: 4-hydroxy-tetrahydrodipicolinate synthase [Thermoprotei archaeon]|nr:MAG: 4-hydroxy-tetrahydrodipicolinate synthase [Thermoprotei archaeon]RLF25488.1 MAG: 4-hydroxy-tetrahydrodipicolinate synthase [Thermoprotei archaeon]
MPRRDERLKGVIALSITPFTKEKEIDEEGLRENISFLVESGVDVIVVNGSCGECYALSLEEQKKIIKIAVDEVNGKIPVYAGTSHTGTKIVVELSKYAEDVGADGVQILPPYYYLADVVAHYREIGKAIDIGIIIYNNPEVVHVKLSPDVIKNIVDEVENVVGIKDCTEDLRMVSKVMRLVGDEVAVLCGTGESLAPFFYLLGSPGTYSSIVNFAPQFPIEMHKAAMRGDYEKVMEIHRKISPLMDFIAEHGPFIRVIKGAMNILGRPAGPVRYPLTPLTKEEERMLKSILKELGLLEAV